MLVYFRSMCYDYKQARDIFSYRRQESNFKFNTLLSMKGKGTEEEKLKNLREKLYP